MKRFVRIAAFLAAIASQVAFAESPPAEPLDRAKVVAAASDVIGQAHYCNFITIGDDGRPNARIVDPSTPDQDLAVWIVTKASSRKAAELHKDPRATLLYFDPVNLAYVTLLGSTSFVSDPAEMQKHWQDKWTPFFPQGTKSPDLTLVRFTPDSVEIVSRAHKLLKDPWGLAILKLK